MIDNLNKKHKKEIDQMDKHFKFIKASTIEREMKNISSKYEIDIQSKDS